MPILAILCLCENPVCGLRLRFKLKHKLGLRLRLGLKLGFWLELRLEFRLGLRLRLRPSLRLSNIISSASHQLSNYDWPTFEFSPFLIKKFLRLDKKQFRNKKGFRKVWSHKIRSIQMWKTLLFAREVKCQILNNLESNLYHTIWRVGVWCHNIPFIFYMNNDCHVRVTLKMVCGHIFWEYSWKIIVRMKINFMARPLEIETWNKNHIQISFGQSST